jgi:hypothetical protein
MWKSIVYKEWLKVRWFLLGLAVLGILSLGSIFLKVQHDILFNEANNYWYFILFQGYSYFGGIFKYVPLVIGVGIGVAQFVPEILNKRIKLTFHLPVNENRALLMMLSFGFLCLFATYAVMFGLFVAFSYYFLAAEIVAAALISVTPWFLAGLSAYFLVALIVMEPIMKYRVFYLVVAYFFITLFLEPSVPGGYAPMIWKLLVLTAMTSVSLLFSAYRFRKGEM